jgi:hypothetical protein
MAAMSKVLDEMPKIYEVAYQDLVGLKDAQTGRIGMTTEQVVRAAILKQYRGLSYEGLAFHLDDSASFRAFARLSRGQHPSASTLQDNVKALSEKTWEEIQRIMVQYAAAKGVEKRRTIRVDSTATETDSTIRRTRGCCRTSLKRLPGCLWKAGNCVLCPANATATTGESSKRGCLRSTTARTNPSASSAIAIFWGLPFR